MYKYIFYEFQRFNSHKFQLSRLAEIKFHYNAPSMQTMHCYYQINLVGFDFLSIKHITCVVDFYGLFLKQDIYV